MNRKVEIEVEFRIKLSKEKDIKELYQLCDKWMKESEQNKKQGDGK